MKTIIKNLLYQVVRFFPNKQGVILMYHSVAEDDNFFSVKPQDFLKQMEYLAQANYQVFSLEQAVQAIKAHVLPVKSVVITFDDGYKNNYEVALPILKKFNFPATVFVSSSLIGQMADNLTTPEPILTEGDVRALVEDGLITIGSHAHDHRKLVGLTDSEIETEFSLSKNILENITGYKIDALAYPYGRYNSRVQAIAEKYYSSICTVKKGRLNNSADLLQLPRNSVDSQVTLAQFKGIVNFGRL